MVDRIGDITTVTRTIGHLTKLPPVLTPSVSLTKIQPLLVQVVNSQNDQIPITIRLKEWQWEDNENVLYSFPDKGLPT